MTRSAHFQLHIFLLAFCQSISVWLIVQNSPILSFNGPWRSLSFLPQFKTNCFSSLTRPFNPSFFSLAVSADRRFELQVGGASFCSQPDLCAWGGPVRDARSLIYRAKSRNCKITWNWALRTVWRLSFWVTGGYLNTRRSHYLKLWPWLIWAFTSATALYILQKSGKSTFR